MMLNQPILKPRHHWLDANAMTSPLNDGGQWRDQRNLTSLQSFSV